MAEIPVRIIVLDPLPYVRYAVQEARDGLRAPTTASPEALQFDFGLRLGKVLADGRPNFLGPFAQGSPQERFVYLNSGQQAGQADSCWSRRAKLMLGGIAPEQVERLLADPALRLQATLPGAGRDLGPPCARTLPSGGRQIV